MKWKFLGRYSVFIWSQNQTELSSTGPRALSQTQKLEHNTYCQRLLKWLRAKNCPICLWHVMASGNWHGVIITTRLAKVLTECVAHAPISAFSAVSRVEEFYSIIQTNLYIGTMMIQWSGCVAFMFAFSPLKPTQIACNEQTKYKTRPTRIPTWRWRQRRHNAIAFFFFFCIFHLGSGWKSFVPAHPAPRLTPDLNDTPLHVIAEWISWEQTRAKTTVTVWFGGAGESLWLLIYLFFFCRYDYDCLYDCCWRTRFPVCHVG